MDIYEIINHRQSDRQYDPERPVEPEKIRRILEAARIAPSACNAQPWHFIVVDEPELRNQVADAVASRILGMNHFTKQAPVHILVVEERPNFTSGIGGLIKDKQFPLLDIGIDTAHPVKIGISNGVNTEIISGINEGTVVVTEATIGSMPGSGAPDMSQEAPGGEKSPFMPGPPGSKKKSGK